MAAEVMLAQEVRRLTADLMEVLQTLLWSRRGEYGSAAARHQHLRRPDEYG